MDKLKTTQDRVEAILENFPETRDNDNLLYYHVVASVHKGIERHTVEYFFTRFNSLDVPAFETVRRTRQKLQAACPWLRANETVESFRGANEKKYRAYAKGAV